MNEDRDYEHSMNPSNVEGSDTENAYTDGFDFDMNLDDYLGDLQDQMDLRAQNDTEEYYNETQPVYDAEYVEAPSEETDYGYEESVSEETGYDYDEATSEETDYGYEEPVSEETDYGYEEPVSEETGFGYEGSSSEKTDSGYEESVPQEEDFVASDYDTSLMDEKPEVRDFTQTNKKEQDSFDNAFSDDVFYMDKLPKKSKAPVVAAVLLILLVIGGGCFAAYHFTDGFTDFAFIKKDSKTEEITEEKVTTEEVTEEATTEEPPKPYATVDYVLHDPHVTDDTIVYGSNSFSLKYPAEEWPIFRNDNGDVREATQEDLYPIINLQAVPGSLNSTNPDPSNPGETQQITSRYMVLVDMSDDSIVAKRDSDIVVNPASMTKILTVLTAVDMIEDLDDTFIMTPEAVQYAYNNGCSAVGFVVGQKVTVRDLIYGTIVCSGGDAAVGLAQYCCGDQETFVEKMNEKAEELNISDTAHFTNVVGVYDENLHCTMEDMAVILSTAMQNDFLRDVLNTRIYQTSADPNVLPEETRKELGIDNKDYSSVGGKRVDGRESKYANGNSSSEESLDEGDTDNSSEESLTDGQTELTESTTDDSSDKNVEDGVSEDGVSEDASSDSSETVSQESDEQIQSSESTDSSQGQTESTDTSTEESTTEEVDPGLILVATEGITISNWFMRRIEDKDTGGEVLGAKTGFVNAAGFCCASYYKSNSGKEYICVTGDTYSSWRCIYDHVSIYRSLAK